MGKRRIKNPQSNQPMGSIPSVFVIPPQKGCADKLAYYSLKDAREAALMARVHGEKAIREYKCQFQDHWHIGHHYDN